MTEFLSEFLVVCDVTSIVCNLLSYYFLRSHTQTGYIVVIYGDLRTRKFIVNTQRSVLNTFTFLLIIRSKYYVTRNST